MSAISKRFPGVVALDRVDLEVAAGEIVGLVGENGAGKSTLMKVLSGVHRADSGVIAIDGVPAVRRVVVVVVVSGCQDILWCGAVKNRGQEACLPYTRTG